MKRKNYLDFARTIAVLSVLAIHVISDRYIHIAEFGTNSYYILLGFTSLFRFAVPLFVMVSGAVFLDENNSLSIKKLLLHNFLRIVIVFFVWDFFYNILDYILANGFAWNMFTFAIKSLITYKYHLWFIPMIAALYLFTPLIRKVCREENRKVVKYFLIVGFIAICLNSAVEMFGTVKTIGYGLNILNMFNPYKFYTNPYLFFEFIIYFVLGWYLDKFIDKSKFKTPLLVIGLIAIPLASLVNILFAFSKGRHVFLGENYFFVLTFLSAIAIFILFKNIKFFGKQNKFIKSVSSCSFGMYLIHVAIIEIAEKHIPENLIFSNWGFLILPGLLIGTVIISYLITLLIKLIFRKFSRYIV